MPAKTFEGTLLPVISRRCSLELPQSRSTSCDTRASRDSHKPAGSRYCCQSSSLPCTQNQDWGQKKAGRPLTLLALSKIQL